MALFSVVVLQGDTRASPFVDILDLRVDNLLSSKTSYDRQKCSLKSELQRFLTLSTKSSLTTATPRDICRFLVWKDRNGKTAVHAISCTCIGNTSPSCPCPRRLAAGTVSSLVGRIRSIFKDLGKNSDWDELAGYGNPAASLMVQQYVKAIRREQSIGHVQVKQATPLFPDKLELIAQYIERQLSNTFRKPQDRYLLLRDQAFFKMQFFAGDRASDLGQMLTREIKRCPNSEGLLITHTWGKTCRMDKVNSFALQPCVREILCPVKALDFYIDGARQMGIDLRQGYLFRPVAVINKVAKVMDKPLSYSAVYERLKYYMTSLGIREGETPHGLRGGCAVLLSQMTDLGDEHKIMEHVGWFSNGTARHYSRSVARLDSTSVSHTLADHVGGTKSKQLAHNFRLSGNTATLPHAYS